MEQQFQIEVLPKSIFFSLIFARVDRLDMEEEIIEFMDLIIDLGIKSKISKEDLLEGYENLKEFF